MFLALSKLFTKLRQMFFGTLILDLFDEERHIYIKTDVLDYVIIEISGKPQIIWAKDI